MLRPTGISFQAR